MTGHIDIIALTNFINVLGFITKYILFNDNTRNAIQHSGNNLHEKMSYVNLMIPPDDYTVSVRDRIKKIKEAMVRERECRKAAQQREREAQQRKRSSTKRKRSSRTDHSTSNTDCRVQKECPPPKDRTNSTFLLQCS